MTEEEIKKMPFLENPKTVRIEYSKTGRLRYISHLDLQRTMGRVISRAKIPVWYSKGFNPHIKLVFALPLPVGVESKCELLDLRLERDMPNEVVKELLNARLTEEMFVSDVRNPEKDFNDISAADYTFRIKSQNASRETADAVLELLGKFPLETLKKTKSGEKIVDISPLIFSREAEYLSGEGVIVMKLGLCAGPRKNLNPQTVVSVLSENGIILNGNPVEERCMIMRERIYDGRGEIFR